MDFGNPEWHTAICPWRPRFADKHTPASESRCIGDLKFVIQIRPSTSERTPPAFSSDRSEHSEDLQFPSGQSKIDGKGDERIAAITYDPRANASGSIHVNPGWNSNDTDECGKSKNMMNVNLNLSRNWDFW
jgi:hypothetical protein